MSKHKAIRRRVTRLAGSLCDEVENSSDTLPQPASRHILGPAEGAAVMYLRQGFQSNT